MFLRRPPHELLLMFDKLVKEIVYPNALINIYRFDIGRF